MSEEAISRALEVARARAARAEHERGELYRVIVAAREEERLLERLLLLRRNGVVSGPDDGGAVAEVEPAQRQEPRGEGRHLAVQAVVEELGTVRRPLHISELMRLLRERKVSIPGSGTQANLISHLRRDERFVRPSRGMYALATWGLHSMPGSRRTRRRKKAMRSTAVPQGRGQA